eukprot:CAMPEP_0202761388 /NCGR_PEP_ID=MMETSP1388-20130828/19634_1 /ASSEMBLY_ACC=CAM_ASM_000864 /TAXON_ID=37098 /ORGANISM="Isochrysis sp, Strain CCMP1244" /LENGTH=153 /DNA_ID=CAMNT_0049429497 /DNA_START=44 /DNA_END=506 /DNA_ORIENTATION=-
MWRYQGRAQNTRNGSTRRFSAAQTSLEVEKCTHAWLALAQLARASSSRARKGDELDVAMGDPAADSSDAPRSMGSLLCDARRLVRRLALDCQVVVILDVHLGKGGRQYLASIVEPAPRAGEAAQGGAASDHFVLLREDELCGRIPSQLGLKLP